MAGGRRAGEGHVIGDETAHLTVARDAGQAVGDAARGRIPDGDAGRAEDGDGPGAAGHGEPWFLRGGLQRKTEESQRPGQSHGTTSGRERDRTGDAAGAFEGCEVRSADLRPIGERDGPLADLEGDDRLNRVDSHRRGGGSAVDRAPDWDLGQGCTGGRVDHAGSR